LAAAAAVVAEEAIERIEKKQKKEEGSVMLLKPFFLWVIFFSNLRPRVSCREAQV